jgi:hypothetical protein
VIRKLPSWEQAEASVKDQAASPLETFIHEFEPAGDDAAEFRKALALALNEPRAFLQPLIMKWSPADSDEATFFQDKLSQLLDWRKAFSSGCPDTTWEA